MDSRRKGKLTVVFVWFPPPSLSLSSPLLSKLPPLSSPESIVSLTLVDRRVFVSCSNEGAWSNAGCELDEKASNSTDTVCRCHHLTNFAVLMSPYRSSSHDDIALSIITYIGCGLSVLGCLVTLIVYLRLWRYLKSTRAHLLMQLCAVLIVFYIIFLAGIERTSDVVACKAVALVLHFLLLVAFFQMLALGVEIAVTVTYVFSATRSKLCYLILLAWGMSPCVCWLSLESGLLFAFVGPALLVILTNSVVLVIVLRAVYSTAVMTTKTKQEKLKAGVRNICVLLPSMGLTWVFGTLAVNERTVVFEYIFAVCNCLQGVFIFVFYCFLNSSVREGVQRLRQRHEVSKNVYSDEAKPHRAVKSLFGFRASNNCSGVYYIKECSNRQTRESDSDNSKKSTLNLSSSVPGESSDTTSDTNIKLEFPPGGFRYRDSWSGQSYPVPYSGQSSECPVRPNDYDASAADYRETTDKRKVGKVSYDGVRRHSDINNYSHRQNRARNIISK
ncbi:hypothetical protein C0Q70_11734 [Pomacea canaliculata]|uniref:G-protein coupled receptors family 2 profile 2 domain-containing protein n=1 Tax=Pomacea canaliculata TaxID=400727 RepID=A0A2T7P6T3_POMCA|nr:hypothetical protein C0Q70_11734 [Pomacea canaliculata]